MQKKKKGEIKRVKHFHAASLYVFFGLGWFCLNRFDAYKKQTSNPMTLPMASVLRWKELINADMFRERALHDFIKILQYLLEQG